MSIAKTHTEPQYKVVRKRLQYLRPSPENAKLYRPVLQDDPAIIELAESIRRNGVLDPLVITADRFVVSGHRRYVAAQLAGAVTVPCHVLEFRRVDDIDRFVSLLREHNRQRDKSLDEKLREELISVDPDEAYASLLEARRPPIHYIDAVHIEGRKVRHGISAAKADHVRYIKEVLFQRLRTYWPVTVRKVHYELLNFDFLRNISKELRYVNDDHSYKATSNLCTRLRFAGVIPWEALTDETRPFNSWPVYPGPRQFMREHLDGLFTNYWRDLMQSQPAHIEVVAEKNTVFRAACDVTMQYCIPTMSGRGFASVDPWHDMAVRFRNSGKNQLVVILATDMDPEGQEIVQVAGRTMMEFGIRPEIIKVALTMEQVERFGLPQNNEAKTGSSRYAKYIARHGHHVYELEALDTDVLQDELRSAIDSVIDVDAFNQELEQEKQDAAFLAAARKTAISALQGLDFESAHTR